MNKVLVTTLGVVLAAGAVSAWAGKAEREQLELCNAEIVEHFGKGTRMRLAKIQRGDDGIAMRMLVRPAGGDNTPVVCVSQNPGSVSLTDEAGVALAPAMGSDEQQVTLAQ